MGFLETINPANLAPQREGEGPMKINQPQTYLCSIAMALLIVPLAFGNAVATTINIGTLVLPTLDPFL
jgi:hypothetical protein